MTAYLKAYGMTEAVLSLFRGAGAAAGVAATLTFPMLHGRLGQLGLTHSTLTLLIGAGPRHACAAATATLPPLHLCQGQLGCIVSPHCRLALGCWALPCTSASMFSPARRP